MEYGNKEEANTYLSSSLKFTTHDGGLRATIFFFF